MKNRIIKVINYIFEQEKENEDFRKKYYVSKIKRRVNLRRWSKNRSSKNLVK